MEKTLSIGELSDLFHINVQTLRYYDSIGLLIPAERNHQTKYRKYRFDQIYTLANILYLRKLDYSLEEISEFLYSRDDITKTLDQLNSHSQTLRKKWQHLKHLDSTIQRKIQFIENKLNEIDFRNISVNYYEDRYYVPIGAEDLLYRDDYFYLNPTIAFYEHDLKSFGAYLYEKSKISLKNHGLETIAEETKIAIIPKGNYIKSFYKGTYEGIPDEIERVRKQKNNLSLDDMTVNFNIIDQFVEDNSNHFVTEIQILILEEN